MHAVQSFAEDEKWVYLYFNRSSGKRTADCDRNAGTMMTITNYKCMSECSQKSLDHRSRNVGLECKRGCKPVTRTPFLPTRVQYPYPYPPSPFMIAIAMAISGSDMSPRHTQSIPSLGFPFT